ncbi:MAG: hypothetical protein BWZ04_03117 [Firmicutes bacterium ADurb.BinA205]|nr:MAG: hypothetical protein BWZ04_03117 [Firmicutes bacterium ADurb.BinA205]
METHRLAEFVDIQRDGKFIVFLCDLIHCHADLLSLFIAERTVFGRDLGQVILVQLAIGIAVIKFCVDTFEIQTAFSYVVSCILRQPHSYAVFLTDILVAVDNNMTVQIDELLGTDKLCEGLTGCEHI